MNISPVLLLIMLVVFVFAPSLQDWVTQGGSMWYRPYLMWLAVVIFVFIAQRRAEQRQKASEEGKQQ